MLKVQKSVSEVQEFISQMNTLCENHESVTINTDTWANGKENKTLTFQAETGIQLGDMINVLQKLKVRNYSYTEKDRNKNFLNEEFWFFGIREEIVDHEEALYIKLKIRCISNKYLLIMSFHPERPATEELKLQFPYSDHKED